VDQAADLMSSPYPFGNDPAKIAGYQAFWQRSVVKRPLVGFSFKSWFPLQEFAASAAWQDSDYLTPEMVDPSAFLDDQERLLREGEVVPDDILRGASPSQAVPWLSGMTGGKLRILPGSILGEEEHLSWDAVGKIRLNREDAWYQKYMAFIDALVARAAGRYPVSHGTLHGPSDLAADLRGHSQSIMDLITEPERATALLERLSTLFRQITEDAWQRIPLYHGGYYDAQYQLWAPGPVIRMQEDATGLYSPRLYRRYLQPIDRELAGHFACAFIHLHSTSMFILDAFLEIEQIRCFEVNYEKTSGGPAIAGMLPYWRMIQQANRPLLIRGSFDPDELRLLLDSLDSRGLYLYIMVSDQSELDALRLVAGM
jgi:hypothetical protein